MGTPDTTKASKAINIALITSCVVVVLGVIIYLLILPSVGEEQQTFWSTVIGSCVGSLLAIAGAVALWKVERKELLTQRRADQISLEKQRRTDRTEAIADERRRSDASNVRQIITTIGTLKTLEYHMLNEDRGLTSRERYRQEIRLSELTATIFSEDLRNELTFITRFIDEDSDFDQFIDYHSRRLETALTWLTRIAALADATPLSSARPKDYKAIKSGYEEAMEIKQEMWEHHDRMRTEAIAQPAAAQAAKKIEIPSATIGKAS